MSRNERYEFLKPKGLSLRTYQRRQEDPRGPRRARIEPPLSLLSADRSDSRGHEALPNLQIARSDYLELGDLTTKYRAKASSPAIDFLEREVSRAIVVDDSKIPSDVATLRSHVVFHDETTGRDWVVTLGHPADFVSRDDAISVLSPLGAALIGLAEGQSIEFQTSDGKSRRIALVRVLYQPDRFGWRAGGGPRP